MEETFSPPRREGLIFHLIMALVFSIGSGAGLSNATQTEVGLSFLAYLSLFLGLTLPLPLVGYRAYALLRSAYLLRPEGIRLTWGLRSEEIPIEDVLWVSPEEQLERSLPLPWLRWPGAVVGTRRLRGGGEVEYMAARSRELIIIATPNKLYAISPEDNDVFLKTFQRLTEIGNLYPIPPRSIYPAFLLGSVWAARGARFTILLGLALSLILLSWISLTTPTEAGAMLVIRGDQNTGRVLSAAQLLLLPIANALFYLLDLLLGLFFFRRPERRILAYLLWGSSVMTSLAFFIALYFILQST